MTDDVDAAGGPDLGSGHESVSSPESGEVTPSAGTLGLAETADSGSAETPEVMSEPVEAPVDEERLRDAWWAGVDVADVRADPREVVIGSDDRVEVSAPQTYPWRAIASLLITAADGSSWIGTGWLAGPRLVVTAGHCVHEASTGGWARRIEVIPGRRGAQRPFGSCTATTLRSVTGWTRDHDRSFDYGAILLPADCRFGDRLGWFGVRRDDDPVGQTVNIAGYPGDKRAGTQWFHANRVTSATPRVLSYEVDTAGGQSGAPVWRFVRGQGRFAVGIHTNGHRSGNSATRLTDPVLARIRAWGVQAP